MPDNHVWHEAHADSVRLCPEGQGSHVGRLAGGHVGGSVTVPAMSRSVAENRKTPALPTRASLTGSALSDTVRSEPVPSDGLVAHRRATEQKPSDGVRVTKNQPRRRSSCS